MNEVGKRLAPTMLDRWAMVKASPEIIGDLEWLNLLALVCHNPEDENLEAPFAVQISAGQVIHRGAHLKHIQDFIALSEGKIYNAVNFLSRAMNSSCTVNF